MKDVILCLSSSSWQSIPTRTQQLMGRMKGVEVLFFEPPAEKGSIEHKKPGRKVRPGVTAYTLPPVGGAAPRQRLRFHHEQRVLGDYIAAVLRKTGAREPLLWCTSPRAVHLLDHIPYRGLIYDCDRYWTGLPLEWESGLAAAADVVFVASDGLQDRLSPCSQNIVSLPNGCNYPMFARADVELPQRLEGAGRPLLGFVGTLWEDLDLSPVFTTAAAHPDWTFLFLGRQEPGAGLDRLRRMDRVILAERCPLIEVPDYVRHLDVCLDLRRQGSASDVFSQRVFEYLAAGKPVARHAFPGEMDAHPGLIYQSDDPHGFAACCEEALREREPFYAARRREAGEEASWEHRSETVRGILEGNMLL